LLGEEMAAGTDRGLLEPVQLLDAASRSALCASFNVMVRDD
jgi:hypothetical protein